MTSSTATSGEGEPRTGTLVFAPVGSARLTRDGTTSEDAPGYASAVAVSGKYGYVVVAHGDAARVMRTHEVAAKVAEWRAREAPASERVLGDDDECVEVCERASGGAAIDIVSMTSDERAFATCDRNGLVEFYATRDSSDGKATADKFGEMTLAAPVRALKWCTNNSSFVVLSAESLVYVEAVGKEAKEVDSGVTCVSARANGTLAWARGNTVCIGSCDDPMATPKETIDIAPFRGPEDIVEVDGLYAQAADRFLLTARSVTEPDDCFLAVLKKADNVWTCTRLESAFDIDPQVVDLAGPVLNANSFTPWNVVFATHRKAWDNQLLTIQLTRGEEPCVLEVEDDRCFASVPMTEDDDNNYVTGLGLDLTGSGGTMLNPQDKSAPELEKGPTLIFSTTDGRITILKCANLDQEEARIGAQSIQTQLTLPTDEHPAKASASNSSSTSSKPAFGSSTPGFSFTTSAPATSTPAAAPAFGFKPADPASTPAFSFKPAEPASTPAAASTPAFSFKPAEPASTPAAASTPAFAFKPAEPASTPTAASTPAFAFKPATPLASPSHASAPAFSFKPAETKPTDAAPFASTPPSAPPVATPPTLKPIEKLNTGASTPSPPRSDQPPRPFVQTETPKSPVDKGMELLKRLSAGTIDISTAELELKGLILESTPTPSPKQWSTAMAQKFTPIDTTRSPAVNLQNSPLPSWGKKLNEIRQAKEQSAERADGLKAIEDDMESTLKEVEAMLDDVSSVTKNLMGELNDGMMPGKSDIDKIEKSSASAKKTLGSLLEGGGQLRSRLNELWAANSSDESLRSELESLISAACDELDEKNSLDDTRELSPALKDVQKNMQLDMRSVLEMAADLEASVERLEAAKREANRPKPKSVIRSGLVSSSTGGAKSLTGQMDSIMKAITTQAAVIEAQAQKLDALLERVQDVSASRGVPPLKASSPKKVEPQKPAVPVPKVAIERNVEPMTLKTPVKMTPPEDNLASDLESVLISRVASTRITTVPKTTPAPKPTAVSPIKPVAPTITPVPPPAAASSAAPTMSFNADFLAKANKGYAAAQKALDDDLKKAEQPAKSTPSFSFAPPPVKTESKADAPASKPAFSFATAPVAASKPTSDVGSDKKPAAATMSFSADFLAKANKGYAAAQDALEKELAEKESESKPTQKFSFGVPTYSSASSASAATTASTGFGFAAPASAPAGGFAFGIPTASSASSKSEEPKVDAKPVAPPASAPAFSFVAKPEEVKAELSESKEKTEKPEEKKMPVPTAAPPMSFSADFLAKANKGYTAAQAALEEDLKKATPPPGTPPSSSVAPKPFDFASAAASVPKFGITTASAATPSSDSETPPKPAFGISSTGANAASSASASTTSISAGFGSFGFGSPSSMPASASAAASAATSAPSFGASSAFGAKTSPASSAAATTSAFDAASPTSTSAFGAPVVSTSPASSAGASTSAFGAAAATSAPAFGAAASSSGFGAATSFGAAKTTSSPAFGAPSAFGAAAQTSTPAFGAPSAFGAAATTSAPAFGAPSAFGAAATTSSPAFGAPSAFGAAAKTSSPAFGSPSAFGAAASSGGGFAAAASKPSGFGAAASSASGFGQSSGFGAVASGGFGAASTQPTTGFGAAATQASTGFGAVATQATTGFGAAAAQSSSGFGAFASQSSSGFGQAAAAGGGFGQAAATAGFGQQTSSGFGQPASPGGFGQPASPSGFGQPQSPTAGGFGGGSGFGQSTGFGQSGGGFGQSTGGGFGQSTGFGQSGGGGFGQASGFGQPQSPSGFNATDPAITQMRR